MGKVMHNYVGRLLYIPYDLEISEPSAKKEKRKEKKGIKGGQHDKVL